MALRVFAIGAHPDDIEFMMAGTLIKLREAGADLHYMHLSSGSCGTAVMPPEEIIPIRKREAKAAAEKLGAEYHESLVHDIEIFYEDSLIRRLTSVVRYIQPDCMLIPSPIDYMEDHQNTARVASTAAFCRGMPNYRTEPPQASIEKPVAVYHAMPYGLVGPLGEKIDPEFAVDITGTEEVRGSLLETHVSQKDWLDASQGSGSYVDAMLAMSREMARRIDDGRDWHAEGWRRRLHLGYCEPDYRPLEAEISGAIFSCP